MKRFLSALSAGYLHLVLAASVQIVLLPFLLESVGKDVTGVYLLLLAVAQLSAVGIGWLAATGVRLIGEAQAAESAEYAREVHRAVFRGFVVYGSGIFVACVLAAPGIGSIWLMDMPQPTVTDIRLALVFLGAHILVNYAHQADLALLVAHLEQARANLYRVLGSVLFAAGAVSLMMFRPSISMLFLAQFVASVICFVLARRRLRREGLVLARGEGSKGRITGKALLRIGLPYLVFGVAQFALFTGDALLIGAVLGPGAVTAYSILVRAPDLLVVICSRISETLIPYFIRLEASADQGGRLAALFLSTSVLQSCVAAAAGASFAVAGPWVLELWVGAEHRPVGLLPYGLAAGAVFFQVVNRHDVILHFAMAKVHHVLAIQTVEAGAKLLVTILLFDQFGFVAPLLAYIALQVAGVTWWYRSSALGVLKVRWRRWRDEVGVRMAAIVGTTVACVGIGEVMREGRPEIAALVGVAIGVAALLTAVPEVRRVRALFG